jgi:hypothetical protein
MFPFSLQKYVFISINMEFEQKILRRVVRHSGAKAYRTSVFSLDL